ncbi:MAG: sialidase family protein [Candidatus Nitrosopumilus sp. bin_7KS]
MKTRLVIIGGIILVAIVFTGISASPMFLWEFNNKPINDTKYQYKFWQEKLEFENNNHFYRVMFSYSHDFGRTFSDPVDMSMTEKHAHEPKMIVMNDDVILVWRDEVPISAENNISFAKSTDFGKTFEKKRVFSGGRPDIKYYDDVIYVAWAGSNLREIWYSDSNDGGETFSEPQLLFEIDWELNPYEEKPTPTLDVFSDSVVVSWKMRNHDDGGPSWIVWKATDQGKDRNFEIVRFAS